jgi:hypothetical protein
MTEERKAALGQRVIWHDERGIQHDALVTAVWNAGMLNLVVVSSNENEQDSYARQIKHETSVNHRSSQFAVHGRYWRFEDEEPISYKAPEQV